MSAAVIAELDPAFVAKLPRRDNGPRSGYESATGSICRELRGFERLRGEWNHRLLDVVRDPTLLHMKVVLAALTALGVSSCYTYPTSSETYRDQIVATRYDTTADFGAYSTFTVAPEVAFVDTVSSDGTPEPVSDDVAEVLLDEVTGQLESAGYELVDPDETADLGVKVTVVKGTVEGVDYVSYWGGYGYYSSYYWGYYYRYTVPVYYEYDTSVVRVDLVDVRDARPAEIAEAQEAGEPPTDLRALWTAVIYGVLEASTVEEAEQATRGIDQAFTQSPYLGGTR